MTTALRISVIIPVLNEVARIDAMLAGLGDFELHEVIVVDGGSSDGTPERLAALGAVSLTSPPGRGAQMNVGAAHATGDVLLFLHADATLPEGAVEAMRGVLQDEGAVSGAFRTWTHHDPAIKEGAWLGPLLHIADLRSHYSNLPYGDQGIFVLREVFERVGGYPRVALMEDLALAKLLVKEGGMVTLPMYVGVSGRRFQAHPVQSFFLMNTIPALYRLGVPTRWLRRLYPDVR